MTEDSLLQVMSGIGQVSARFSQIAAIVGLLGGLVGERRVEIGVMKAVGWQSRHVEQVFLLEGFLLSLAGGLIGFLLRWGVALLLGQLPLPGVTETATQTIQSMAMVQTGDEVLTLPARVDALTLALAVLASLAGGTFASWSSARQAASLKPAQSLSQH